MLSRETFHGFFNTVSIMPRRKSCNPRGAFFWDGLGAKVEV